VIFRNFEKIYLSETSAAGRVINEFANQLNENDNILSSQHIIVIQFINRFPYKGFKQFKQKARLFKVLKRIVGNQATFHNYNSTMCVANSLSFRD
jgi:hypothetical protein